MGDFMELTHLKYFMAVAEELHFGRAAKRLNVSQPPLSQQIMKLEDELGVKLFKRSSRVVELTEAGKFFMEEVKAVLGRVTLMEERMARISSGRSGTLAVGFNEPVLNTVLPRAVDKFRRRYPEVELQLFEMETPVQLTALRNREIQLALLRPYGFDLTGLQARLLYQEPYLLALPAGHKLLAYDEVALSRLEGAEIIMFARRTSPVLFDDIVRVLNSPVIRQEAANKATILALVKAGLGVGIVPESSKLTAPPGVEFRPLGPGLPSVDIMAVWDENNSSAPLLNFIRQLN